MGDAYGAGIVYHLSKGQLAKMDAEHAAAEAAHHEEIGEWASLSLCLCFLAPCS